MKYQVILADPPWSFKTYSEKGTGRGAISHYDTMSFADIAKLNISDYAADNCVLLLWAIDPMLPKAYELIYHWGFTFKTVGFYWVKTNIKADTYFTGLGYWTRANPEQCLLATRGKPQRLARNVPRLIVSKRREHSRKPEEIYGRIERLVAGPYLELFARETRPGWDTLGNQTTLFDHGSIDTRRQPSDLSKGLLRPASPAK